MDAADHKIDLNAYFERIGYRGDAEPTLATLRALHLAHAQSIPFENLNPLLGLPVKLDQKSLMRKLVHERRGGYCFEQNLLFQSALSTLGFATTGLSARVVWNYPEGAITMRGHMLLKVDLPEGPHIADVGFGGMTPTAPLRLQAGVEQETPHEPFRLTAVGDEFLMQAKAGEDWKALYRFDLRPTYQVDYEVASYYLSTHPASHFRSGLIAARPAEGRRYALSNGSLAIHHAGAATERRDLRSVAEVRDALTTIFEIQIDALASLDEKLATLVQHQRDG